LRRLIRFVEATPEEGVRMMLDQLRGQVDRITASADRYKLKEQKKEYLTRAGSQSNTRKSPNLNSYYNE